MEILALKEEIKKLRLEQLDPLKYKEWNHEEMLQWIFSLDDGRFRKYEEKLRIEIGEEEPSGQDLDEVKKEDIKRWGIKKFADINKLKKCIEDLVNAQQMNQEHHHIAPPNIEGGVASGVHFR